MEAGAVARAAGMLATLRRRPGSLADLPVDCRPPDLAAAYDIQDALGAALREAGFGPRAGYKIGCTNKVMQDFLGVDHPCAGGVLAGAVRRDAARLSVGDYCKPGIECEIAVTVGEPIPPREGPYDAGDVAPHVAACHAAIEVVDARFPDFETIALPTMVADDFYNAAAIVGPPVADWQDLDLAAVAGRMTVNGGAPRTGTGAQLLGHPLNALAWLATHLSARGQEVPAGSLVMLGSLVETHWATAGDEVMCELSGLGTVRVAFAD